MEYLRKTKDYMKNAVRHLAESILEKTKDAEAPVEEEEVSKLEVVELNVYDLCADKLPGMIWHTGIVIFGVEYYFCDEGLKTCEPGKHPSKWKETIFLGATEVDKAEFEKRLDVWKNQGFVASNYNLLLKNCNHFSKAVCEYFFNVNMLPYYVKEFMDAETEEIRDKMCKALKEKNPNLYKSIKKEMGFLAWIGLTDVVLEWFVKKSIESIKAGGKVAAQFGSSSSGSSSRAIEGFLQGSYPGNRLKYN